MIGVLYSKLIRGCNSLQGEDNLTFFQNNCQEIFSLGEMLTRQFRTDAHFTCYSITDFPAWPRLNKSILPEIRNEGRDIVLSYFTFDWDNINHTEWTEESLSAFAILLGGCKDPVISSWSAIYTTLHGMRLIYTLSEPVPVDQGEEHLAWMFNHFKENGFENIDENCKDWTRCMRCPQVIRDDIQTWTQSYYSMTAQDDILDMKLVGKRPVNTIARNTVFIKDKQEMLPFDVLESLLLAKDASSGRLKQTDYYKKSKRILKDSYYLDILFNEANPVWTQGHRNDEIQKMLGSITPPLLRQGYASIHQIFALAIGPLLTLDNDQDWISHGWNALLDIYEREVGKLNLQKKETAEKISEGVDTLDGMVVGIKEWCINPELFKSDEAAREFATATMGLSPLRDRISSASSCTPSTEPPGLSMSMITELTRHISKVGCCHAGPLG